MGMLSGLTIEKQHEFSHATGELTTLLSAIRLGAKTIHHDIDKVGLTDILGANDAENVQDEVQQKLNLFTSERLGTALKAHDIVVGIISEKGDEVVIFEGCKHVKYVVLTDPLDGSSSIGANVSVDTVLSIYHCVTPVSTPVTEGDFLQPSDKQVATGYMIYGFSTMLVYTTGCDVHAFIYDPSLGVFYLYQERMRFPGRGKAYSVNEGDYIKLPSEVERHIKFYQEEDKPTNRLCTSRYIGSPIAGFYCNLLKGGIYLYLSTTSHPDGRLRSLYKRSPMAFLVEQAGGKAGDSKERILDIIPETLHQRCSLFVSSDHTIKDVERSICEFPDT